MKNILISVNLLLVLFIIFSCENRQSGEDSEEDSISMVIIGKWQLVDIVYHEPPLYIVFEDLKCINNKPYGVTDGKYDSLDGFTNQPDSLTEFNPGWEYWTFYTGDSLVINRDGVEFSQCRCVNNEVICMTAPGFPVFKINGTWALTDSNLHINTASNESETFKIAYAGGDSMVFESSVGNLIFKND